VVWHRAVLLPTPWLTLPVLPAAAPEAAPPGPEARAEALAREALAQNPDLKALGEAKEAAGTRPRQAGALPDPTVSVLYINDGWNPSLGEREMTTLGVMASQELPWPGKRDLRRRIAEQEAVPSAERLERQRLAVAAGVRRAFWSLVLAQESLAVLRDEQEVWKETEGVARARYAVGQGAQQDVLPAQVEITRLEQRRAGLEAELEAREAELTRLVGREVKRDEVAGASLVLRPETRDLATLQAAAEAALPELRAVAAAVERGALAVDLARRDFKPDLAVQAGYRTGAASTPCGRRVSASRCRSRGPAAAPRSPRRRRAAAPPRSGSRPCARRSGSARGSGRPSSARGVKIFGADLAEIERLGGEVEAALRDVPGTRSAFAERAAGGYFVDLDLRRDELARYGLSVGAVQDVVTSAIGGENVTGTVEGRAASR
jgi:hypothetical protein